MNRQSRNRVVGAADPGKVAYAREQPASATPGEKALWELLRGRRLGVRFHRQHPLQQYVLDFCCAEAKLAIEVDGAVHDEQKGYDGKRDGNLAEGGTGPFALLTGT